MFFRNRFNLTFVSLTNTKRMVNFAAVSTALVVSNMAIAAQSTCTDPSNEDCLCKPDILGFPNNKVAGPDGGALPIVLEADDVESDGDKKITLKGKAFVAQGRQSVGGDTVVYDRENDKLQAQGNVELRSLAGDQITADSLNLDINTAIGNAKNAKFKLAQRGDITEDTNAVLVQSRGSAKTVLIEGQDLVRLNDVEYTNCIEGNDDFLVKAGELELDRATGMGTAKSAKFIFKGVPFFYLPQFTFPITDQRKSGFLVPGIGNNSESGFIFDAPWYWNIAPNADATITPRLMSKRGVQLGVQARYMSEKSQAEMNLEYLPGDKEFEDENRSMLALDYDHQFNEKFSAKLDINDVSDVEYFRDFRSDVNMFSTTYTPSEASLRYNEKNWSLSARAVKYQVVNSTVNSQNTPYDILPQLNFNNRYKDIFGTGVVFSSSASSSKFKRDGEEANSRFTFVPSIEKNFKENWGYTKPKLSINHASYSLDGQESRTAPVFSLDSGLYLEKRIQLAGQSALQTLEPRIFYVNAKSDAENTNFFDTKNLGYNNFNDLFSETGFTGSDGLADGQRVTFALSSRIFDSEGEQKLKAQIGQALFLDDLEIDYSPNNNGIKTVQDQSDLLVELDYKFNPDLSAGVFLGYGQDIEEMRNINFNVNYKPSDETYVKFDYRENKGALGSNSSYIETGTPSSFSVLGSGAQSQFIAQAGFKVSPRLNVFAKERYDLDASENIQTQLGFEYDACCWKLRLTADKLRRSADDYRNSIYAEIEFTGLGGVRTSF